jgi:calreticulin
MRSSLVFFGLLSIAVATVYYSETFDGDWESRWVPSTYKGADAGKFDVSAGKFYGDAQADKGLHTTQDAKFYQITSEIAKEFSNKDKKLILQYSVKHEQNIDCGGGYIKIHPAGISQDQYNGDSQYNIMFGPDICGATKRTHVILTYKGKNYLIKKEVRCESDQFTHLYTLTINPDNTYEVLIDGESVAKGSIAEDWDILPPKEIKDPAQSKPVDWVDAKKIADPEDVKPAGWDDIPKEIPDPSATKPEDWDEELDGEWERPTIDNPEYKGEWQPKLIDNPAYKGEWVHPLIPNPDYVEEPNLYLFESNKFVGFELWQVKSGTIFDNILITDDAAEAEKWAEKTKATREAEKKAFDKQEEEKRAAEAEAAEATKDDKENRDEL